MNNILILDTSCGSLNKGDEIIMECVRKELSFVLKDNFELNLPTHIASFHWYQVARGLARIRTYEECVLKFVGGTNLLVKDMFTYYPQWNINLMNCRPFTGSILVGVGAGAGDSSNFYTRLLYRRVLSHEYIHSVRDERSKEYVESLGLKAINTGCVTMWAFTPEFCRQIPVNKSNNVIFTVTASSKPDHKDQVMIDTLLKMYDKVFFWPQGYNDYAYLKSLKHTENIHIIQATKEAYDRFLSSHETDYVGTRLHGGIYAMRHRKRAVILAIDERALGIHQSNNLNCLTKERIGELESYLAGPIATKISMPAEQIQVWKNQFIQ